MFDTTSFNTIKDFEYLTKHSGVTEIFSNIMKNFVDNTPRGINREDGLMPECMGKSDLGFCQVSFDRKSGVCRYRVIYEDGAKVKHHKDCDDLADVIAFIASRWY